MRLIFGRDPAVITALLEAVVLAATTFLTDWSAEKVGAIQLVVSLLLTLYVAWGTVDKASAVLLQLVKAALVLLVTFGVDITADRQAVILGLVVAGTAAFTRTQVTARVNGTGKDYRLAA